LFLTTFGLSEKVESRDFAWNQRYFRQSFTFLNVHF
jgi:hypothetical protein